MKLKKLISFLCLIAIISSSTLNVSAIGTTNIKQSYSVQNYNQGVMDDEQNLNTRVVPVPLVYAFYVGGTYLCLNYDQFMFAYENVSYSMEMLGSKELSDLKKLANEHPLMKTSPLDNIVIYQEIKNSLKKTCDINGNECIYYTVKGHPLTVRRFTNYPTQYVDSKKCGKLSVYKSFTSNSSYFTGKYLAATTKVQVIQDVNEFSLVKYNNNNYGYVLTKYLTSRTNKAPQITANNRTIWEKENFSLQSELSMNKVSAYDFEDGYLNTRIRIAKNNVNTKVPGTYEVVYKVTDRGGLSNTKTVKVTVKKDMPAVINAKDIVLWQGEKLDTKKEIANGVTVTDDRDKNLLQYVCVSSNNVNVNVPGTYSLKYSVLDRGGNRSYKTVKVYVKKDMPAVINAKDIVLWQGEKLDIKKEIANGVTVTDDRDKDLLQYICLSSNNVNINIPGTYSLTYSVLDRGGNRSYKTVKVYVKKDMPAVINAKDIVLWQGEKLDIKKEISNGVTVTDDRDKDLLQYVCVSSNNVNINVPGTYSLTYCVLDRGGNRSYKTVKVYIREKSSQTGINTTKYSVINTDINIRKTKSWSGEIVAVAKKGSTLDVISIQNGWAQILYNGCKYYVPSSYLVKV